MRFELMPLIPRLGIQDTKEQDMPSKPQTDLQKLEQENAQLRASLTDLENARAVMLTGLEKLGWPCRLEELPTYTATLSRLLSEAQEELARLRQHL
jgi:hypothetical protein